MTPAEKVIKKLGGYMKVAEGTGYHRTTIYRWTWPRSKGGTGGVIPISAFPRVKHFADAIGVSLTGADMYPTEADEIFN